MSAGLLEDHETVDPGDDFSRMTESKNRSTPYSSAGDRAYLSASITEYGLRFAAFIEADRNASVAEDQ